MSGTGAKLRRAKTVLLLPIVAGLLALFALCAPQEAAAAPPACGDTSATVLEDSAANPLVLPGCTDPDLLQVVTCALNIPPANGTATVNATCLAATYTPDANFCGTDSFTYMRNRQRSPTVVGHRDRSAYRYLLTGCAFLRGAFR